MLPISLLGTLVGLSLISIALFDAFETVVLPRRVSRRWRVARFFYRITWQPYSSVARTMADDARRETFLSFYGPSSLLLLVAVWAIIIIFGFAALQWAAGSSLNSADIQKDFWAVRSSLGARQTSRSSISGLDHHQA